MPTAHDREDHMRKHKKTVNITVQQLKEAHPEIFGSASASAASPARATQQDSVPSTMDHATRGDELLPAAGDVELQRRDGIPSSTLPLHSIRAPQGSATTWMLAGTPPPLQGSAAQSCAPIHVMPTPEREVMDVSSPSAPTSAIAPTLLAPAFVLPPVLPSAHAHNAPAPASAGTHDAPAQESAGLASILPAALSSASAPPATVGDANFPRATANTNPSYSTLVADKLREGFELLRNGVLPVCCPVTQVPLVRNRLGHILSVGTGRWYELP